MDYFLCDNFCDRKFARILQNLKSFSSQINDIASSFCRSSCECFLKVMILDFLRTLADFNFLNIPFDLIIYSRFFITMILNKSLYKHKGKTKMLFTSLLRLNGPT